jgi:fatty-acyl-CoA synthase
MVVQCREQESDKRDDLVRRLQGLVRSEVGIECHVELVPLHTLPRTSSGKLSRSKARENFIRAHRWGPRRWLDGRPAEPMPKKLSVR